VRNYLQLARPGLTPQLWALLAGLFVMNMSFFMMAPFLAVYVSDTMGMGAVAAGTVLMVTAISQKGLMWLAGIAADRYGHRRALLGGLALRVAGYVLYAFAGSMAQLIVAAMLSGLGGALFTPAVRSAIATLAPPGKRTVAFALRNLLNNSGTAIGPMLGAFLVSFSMRLVFLASASIYAFMLLVFLVFFKKIVTLRSDGAGFRKLLASVMSHRRFVVLTLLNAGVWILYAQLTTAMPLAAAGMVADKGQIGLLLTVNGLTILLLQYPATVLVTNMLRPLSTITLGVLLMTAGLASVAVAPSFQWLLFSVVLLSIGEMLVFPTMDTVVADMAQAENIGTFYGFSMMASGIGGSLGNYLGGWSIALAAVWRLPDLPWIFFGAIGAITTVSFLKFSRQAVRLPLQRAA
jgi:DHA1 family multidrug resistance protein-like MFS transporter